MHSNNNLSGDGCCTDPETYGAFCSTTLQYSDNSRLLALCWHNTTAGNISQQPTWVDDSFRVTSSKIHKNQESAR